MAHNRQPLFFPAASNVINPSENAEITAWEVCQGVLQIAGLAAESAG